MLRKEATASSLHDARTADQASLDPPKNSPAEIMERQLFSQPLSRVLGKLNAVEGNLLVLRIFEEKSTAEIGEILIKSLEAVMKKVHPY
ncbi:RNA polymerase sigma factor [Paenibacillus sp. W2I17]|uniref:RNA polymerase sigma factor n=1 Tax=Paenibacillus sp. W2I17 TaxID=3042311 RepID=UPI002788C4BC|nr:hypothetical protein [Paenibacillus sp. W2I17]MDQ0655997.1 DNA-directed RNA polymerase specialized sigma24 family protein [Paenibacillus sp. W2I17]